MSEQVRKILIVEDRPDHARLLTALLEEGFVGTRLKIDHVKTGEEAKTRLEKKDAYDVCLLDYRLADEIDGLAVLRAIRAKRIGTPVVLLTALGDEAVAVEAMKLGAQDYLRKEALSAELLRSTIHYSMGIREEEVLRQDAQSSLQEAKTELEQRLGELDVTNEELVVLTRQKDDFVQSISHELRTPLTSIMLYHNLLASEPAQTHKYLATLRRETDRLHLIIEDLLNLAREAHAPTMPKRTTFNINFLVLLYVADRALLAEERGLQLTVKEDASSPRLTADRAQVERALGILVINALNYTPRGGEVTVNTHSQKRKGKQWVGISVSDTGPGISQDEQSQVFERFYRGKAALSSGVPGAGLGLSIAKEIVERHRGEINVESEGKPGEGATFTIWLPADSPDDD